MNWFLCDKLLSRPWHLPWRTENNSIVLRAVKSSVVKTGNDQTLLLTVQERGVDKNKQGFFHTRHSKNVLFQHVHRLKKQLNTHRKKKKRREII